MQLWMTSQYFLNELLSTTTSGVALYNEKKNESWWEQENLFIAKVDSFCLEFSCVLAERAVNCNSKEALKNLDGNMEKAE